MFAATLTPYLSGFVLRLKCSGEVEKVWGAQAEEDIPFILILDCPACGM